MATVLRLFTIISLLVAGDCKAKEKQPMNFEEARGQMVQTQLKARDISDTAVLDAINKVERHRFVRPVDEESAYSDGPLPIGHGQTISQPYVVAFMTQALKVKPGDRVLEIGTGSGYQAAVLAELVKEVYTIEIVTELCKKTDRLFKSMKYKNIITRCGDGYAGWAEKAPFDAIVLTAAPPKMPAPLLGQLKASGKLIAPVGDVFQELILYQKNKDGSLKKKKLLPVRFVPMTGRAQQ